MEEKIEFDQVYGISLRGPRDHNEDALLGLALDDAVLLAVADGMGGHAGGDIAARLACDTLCGVVRDRYRPAMTTGAIQSVLRQGFEAAHQAILDSAVSGLAGMGATLVAAVITSQGAVIANCGDCRAYRLGPSGLVHTRDHSLIRSLVSAGLVEEEEGRTHPWRHVVTHSLGHSVTVDCYHFSLEKGDSLLLCSDGLHDPLEDDLFREGAQHAESRTIVDYLIGHARKTSTDNISAIIWKGAGG
jgi:serine/threonine protein phosphatase PrpC